MNNSNLRESREEIRDRMIRTAMSFWGIKRVEEFDPAVRLLMEALAEQLYLQSTEISEMETRIMDKVSRVLIPEEYTNASPAHGILLIHPTKPKITLNKLDVFSLGGGSSFPKNQSQNILFSPVCTQTIHRGEVRMLLAAGELFKVDSNLNKRLIYREDLSPENFNKICVGISLDLSIESLEGLQFYIDFPNIVDRNQYLHILSHVNAKIKNIDIKLHQGIISTEENNGETLQNWAQKEIPIEKVNSSILVQYQYNYLRILSDIKHTKDLYSKTPPLYIDKKSELKKENEFLFDEELLWIEFIFPPHFPTRVVSDILFTFNAIPIANKKLVQSVSKSRKTFGVVPLPLESNEYFLGIHSVSDSFGRSYEEAGISRLKSSDGTYSVRKGGCESFDDYDAQSFLIRFRDILFENISVFEAMGKKNNKDLLVEMERLANHLQHRIKDISAQGERPRYLFVDQREETDYIYVEYWTSYGEHANEIAIGTPFKSNCFRENSECTGVLLTPTTGGSPVPSNRLRIARFKNFLGSRDRIVTKNDIRNFCMSELVDIISAVQIEKGVQAGGVPGDGLVRTIDVHLVLLAHDLDIRLKQAICDNLLNRLKERSPMTFNYRIIID